MRSGNSGPVAALPVASSLLVIRWPYTTLLPFAIWLQVVQKQILRVLKQLGREPSGSMRVPTSELTRRTLSYLPPICVYVCHLSNLCICNLEILQLCLWKYVQGESIHQIAADAELSAGKIYRAKRCPRVYGRVFWPAALTEKKRNRWAKKWATLYLPGGVDTSSWMGLFRGG